MIGSVSVSYLAAQRLYASQPDVGYRAASAMAYENADPDREVRWGVVRARACLAEVLRNPAIGDQ